MSWYRFTAKWNGPGGPGYSHFDVRAADESLGGTLDSGERNAIAFAYAVYFETLKSYCPNEWSVGVQQEYERFSDAGALEETGVIGTALGTAIGTYAGTWAGAVGVCTKLNTDQVINGRKVRGKTFYVPAGSTVAFDADGTLNGTCIGDFNNARIALHNTAASNFGVPVVFSPTHNNKFDITGFSIADRSAVLRSRRD